jgi:hypothetical protein
VIKEMGRFASILNDLAGMEQFLIEQNLYLVAAAVRGLRGMLVERVLGEQAAIQLPPSSNPTSIKNWEDFQRIFDELPSKIHEAVFKEWEGPEDRKYNIYKDLISWLAGIYYQLRLSQEGALALKQYLEFRAQQMLNRRPVLKVDDAWEWWRGLKALAQTFLKVHEDTNEHFSRFMNEEDVSHRALNVVVEVDTPDDYKKYGVISTNALRLFRDLTFRGDFHDMLVDELVSHAHDRFRQEVYGALQGAIEKDFPVSEVNEETIAEILSQNSVTIDGGSSPLLGFLGLRIKAAKVVPEKNEAQYLVFCVEPTNELGKKIVDNFTAYEPPTYRLGEAAVYIIALSRRPWWHIALMLSSYGVSTALTDLAEQKLSSEVGILEFLRKIKESGLLERFDILSRAVEWVEGFGGSRRIEAWNAIVDFVRDYYERQRERATFGIEVTEHLSNWLQKAKVMLQKYGNLTSPPQEEQKKFVDDVQQFVVDTERVLSMMHGAGGMLTKLTRTGTYSEIFRLIALRAGVFQPAAVRQYWQREGDKKRLLKWLILRRVL